MSVSAASRVILMVTAEQERGYLAARHGLHPANRPAMIEELASAVAGLHAARLPTPFVTLRARLPEFAAAHLRRALEPDGTLIKLRTCRRTLHIYPLAEAPVVHTATLRQRLGACTSAIRRLGKKPSTIGRVTPPVRAALATGPLPYRELEQQVMSSLSHVRVGREMQRELVRIAIKWLWESGELVYRNTAESLHRERREFQLTSDAYPSLQLDHGDTQDAIRLLLRRYLHAFGPASVPDFQWWSGLTRKELEPALVALRSEVIEVQIKDGPAPMLMLAENESRLRSATRVPADHVELLAYEDPSLKGYFATRHRYVDDRYRSTLFNTIGEVRASITVAGRCVGTWKYDRRTRTIAHNLFTPIPPSAERALGVRLEAMTAFLRSEPC